MQNHNSVAIYIRVSTLYQVDKDSLPMQRQDLVSYCRLMLNTDDYEVFEDAGYSGKNTDRPRFQEMMSKLRSKRFTHLLVWKIDRISRNLLDFSAMYKELKDLGVTFVSKNEQFDTSTAMGEAMLKIILVFAELERNMTSERVLATMISRASNGLWNGGNVPFGYSYDAELGEFSIVENEARLIRLIYDQYEESKSLTQVARLLNGRGYRSRAGNEWSPTAVSQILNNIFYCGHYRYNVCSDANHSKIKDESKWVTVADHHPAIITDDQRQRVQTILNGNTKLKRLNRFSKHVHVFGGLLYCPDCNKALWAAPTSKRRRLISFSRYTCPSTRASDSHHCKSVSDIYVGEFLFNFILNILNLQKIYKPSMSLSDIERWLLSGNIFRDIDHIDQPSLIAICDMLNSQCIGTAVFGKPLVRQKPDASAASKLKDKRLKILRAVDRLNSLYLYSEESMSEQEYIMQKSKLNEDLKACDAEFASYAGDPWESSIPDDELVRVASEFIINKKLSDRNYVSYEGLASSTDPSVLKTFVGSLISSIYVRNGLIISITFKNHLECQFARKEGV